MEPKSTINSGLLALIVVCAFGASGKQIESEIPIWEREGRPPFPWEAVVESSFLAESTRTDGDGVESQGESALVQDPCSSYPTNAPLKWQLTMPSTGSTTYSDLSLGPDGTLYVAIESGLIGSGVDNSVRRVWAINSDLVDTNVVTYPEPDAFTKWKLEIGAASTASTPIIGNDGAVYTAARGGEFVAVNSTNGSLLWTFRIALPRLDPANYVLGENTVYLATTHGIYALTNAFGETNTAPFTNVIDGVTHVYEMGRTNVGIKWFLQFDYEFSLYPSPALFQDQTLYVNTHWGYLVAFDACTGSLIWTTASDGFGAGPPAIDSQGTVYFGAGNRVFAVDPTSPVTNGIIGFKWFSQGATNEFGWPLEEIFSAPVLGAANSLYITMSTAPWAAPTATNSLVALDRSTGQLTWRAELSVGEHYWHQNRRGTVALASDGQIYVTGIDGMLFSFCPDGRTNWTHKLTSTGGLLAPLIGPDGTIFVRNYPYLGDLEYVYAVEGVSPVACSSWPLARKNARAVAAVAPGDRRANLSTPSMTPAGFEFVLAGPTNSVECVCATTNFVEWTNLGQIVLATGSTNLVDTDAPSFDYRFYVPYSQ